MMLIACDRYLASDGQRELVLLPGAAGTRLLIDRRRRDGGDARLLAHLSREEPDDNARLVCREYLGDPRRSARPLRADDLLATPDGADNRDGTPRAAGG